MEVPDGVAVICGVVVSVRQRRPELGERGQARMLVDDDRGFRVWGPMPRQVQTFHFWDDAGRYRQHMGVVPGDRVRFRALVRPSATDDRFGVFARPVRVSIVD